MPTLRPNFSYELTETYTTESGENRLKVEVKTTDSQEIDGSFVNATFVVGRFDIGYGGSNVATANVEQLLFQAVPVYFTE